MIWEEYMPLKEDLQQMYRLMRGRLNMLGRQQEECKTGRICSDQAC